jgi:hypothetical protein
MFSQGYETIMKHVIDARRYSFLGFAVIHGENKILIAECSAGLTPWADRTWVDPINGEQAIPLVPEHSPAS